MPTVARLGPYRFFFYSGEGDSRPHIHVERGRDTAIVWFDSDDLSHTGLAAAEAERVGRIVSVYQSLFEEAWRDHSRM